MALFFGIVPGEKRAAPGIRVASTAHGERVWMHGDWPDLGPEHAVVWWEREVSFVARWGRFAVSANWRRTT